MRWSDVGGLEDVKASLQEAVQWPLQHAASFARLGAKVIATHELLSCSCLVPRWERLLSVSGWCVMPRGSSVDVRGGTIFNAPTQRKLVHQEAITTCWILAPEHGFDA